MVTSYLGELTLAIDAGLEPCVDVLARVLWEDKLADVSREGSYIAHRARVREVLPMAIVEARKIRDRSQP
jgi:hypothetical protein